ncbi:Superinfection exclusion protein B [Selenomonas ruminantium]|uniref:Superinfection exclusion protein B n=1 Tax=Selenomonas ruminantium TaxID=971 RepID=A0A1I3ER40_SELRU|nr:super-infection exclusion protein B [Selenomonas ruminantium]SFI01320.1 Superinfection exclusion protein B [Selenomonas ruminantium]
MAESIKSILALFRLSIESHICITLFTGSCLLLPKEVLEKIDVFVVVNNYRSIIGTVFLLSICFIVVKTIKYIIDKYQRSKLRRIEKEYLLNLDKFQTQIIMELLQSRDYTREYDCKNGSITKLEQYRIIYRTSSVTANYDMQHIFFPYTLNPWVLDAIDDDKKLKKKFSLAFDRSTR